MAKRRVKRHKAKKHHKKHAKTHKKHAKKHHRKTAKKAKTSPRKKAVAANRKAHWAAFRELQKRCDKAWAKIRADVKRKAKPQIMIRDRNHLLLLLGECNYMARECMRIEMRRRRRR